MIKVKLNVCRCGDGLPELPGQIVTVPDDEAERLIADGQADLVEQGDQKPERRKATKGPAETR